MILSNYYGIYTCLSYGIGATLVIVLYASFKTRFLDAKINQINHQRINFLFFFPLVAFLAGPTDNYTNNFTRSTSMMCLLASLFAFSSFYVYILPLDFTLSRSILNAGFLTILSSSLLHYATFGNILSFIINNNVAFYYLELGVYHVISIDERSKDDKKSESKYKIIQGFNYCFGVAFISLF